ncbi:DsrC family protein [Sulfuricella denitrificans skB26]|uniref:DsrC family protein n=1 Tax=Sulfuricella denitrificans (strain DSM 22764 / NBRC 105220 / skB26) TaxID=1163617 RepID=S6ACQ6_SULDS|nr:TusE/DsrC/DsvC family sulfur relay protein [Sulfuricella denitrificans]BAN35763.1 DsrC family protein [Sulfuricella denitrificans skB26]
MDKTNTTQCELTPAGRLKNLADWDKNVAAWLAEKDGITLTEAHWEIILMMRKYYETYNISPILKLLKREIREKLDAQKAENVYLDKLFPNGVLTQGSKIAGLPVPILDVEIEKLPVAKAKPAAEPITTPPAHKHFIGSFEFQGKVYPVYEKGNLANLDDWSEPLAEFMARQEGINLTPAHWEIIHFMRQFYFKYGISPMVRLLMKNMRDELGASKGSDEYLYKLFPGGPSRQGSRIAGLPEPQGCID